MTVNFNQDYQINQARHQARLDESQQERDWREAKGIRHRHHKPVDVVLSHFFTKLGHIWAASKEAFREEFSPRQNPTLRPK